MARSAEINKLAAGPVEALRNISAMLERRADELSRPLEISADEATAELDLRAKRLAEERFGEQLTLALAERDARLIEMEAHATKRFFLLEQASEAAHRFETEAQESRVALEVERVARRALEARLQHARGSLEESRHVVADQTGQNYTSDSGGSMVDIYRQGDPLVLLGASWYGVENAADATFRWVSDNAEIAVATMTRAPYSLLLEIEPGPGVGSKPFDIGVFEGDAKVATLSVPGRKTVALDIPAGDPTVKRYSLRVENAGPATPTPGDSRLLRYRIFKLELVRKPSDVVHAGQGIKVGKGWYPLETFNGQTFRWAGPEVTFELENGKTPDRIALEVEPGPGVDLKPFKVVASVGGKQIGEIEIKSRQRLELALPAGSSGPLKLAVPGGGKAAPNDPRIMNFRAFSAAE